MNFDIAKAWKDAQYRETLTSEELAQLPQNPIGAIELTDAALSAVSGACGSSNQFDPSAYYGYQFDSYMFDGYFQPYHYHRHRHHHCHGGNNWFGGWQQPNGGGNWFGGNQGNNH
ncbi:mersacidin/lichenicidin family type 2 lantibiotic [Dictyobacter aurantiacus]|uniref:Mersacidin/lichenicidin family type 2 lantibiotic n=1 Tax=Dictyobacter aurantiacus TaxID=1936993 RepID=A0A401ZM97_9CHLR|nr:mersacidin/lichenicidin family type 2 lantibiotic [Dictyobacter aurantiacus]GCE07983.1 hypothetical protein KDAU_53120 [Dictyobacter aurantiacus]